MLNDALSRFRSATRQDLATLLMVASRAVNEDALAEIDPAGTSGVRVAHIPLIAALDDEGTRLVTLATRMGITRQAVAALVRHLTDAGITDVVGDPLDRRAQRVHLTPSGADLCHRAVDYLERREAAWRREYGDDALLVVRSVLMGLANATGEPTPSA